MNDDKSNLSSQEKEAAKDEGAERARDGKGDGTTVVDDVFGNEEKNEIRQESFEHAKDVMRDEETRKSLVDEDDK